VKPKTIIIIFTFSPCGKWGNESFSFKQLGLLPLLLLPSEMFSLFVDCFSPRLSVLAVLFDVCLQMPKTKPKPNQSNCLINNTKKERTEKF